VALAPKYDPLRTAHELREQMASAKRRTGLFLGAGTSMAAKLPGLDELTKKVGRRLTGSPKEDFDRIVAKLGNAANVETILNRVRLIRELIADDGAETFDGISNERAKQLDVAICQAIYREVRDIPVAEMGAHYSLASWVRHVRRDEPVELFTTNYDLLLESAFEARGVPFFDGFVGVVAPFFVPRSVEADGSKLTADDAPPRSWTRLWKLHGSIGWQLRQEPGTSNKSIVRIGSANPEPGTELVIFPSADKFSEARRVPFATYMDRLRKFLSSGESLLLLIGYSFGDEHINGIITQALRANTRAALNAFVFGPVEGAVLSLAKEYRNLSAFGFTSACIGGDHAGWVMPTRSRQPGEEWPFWDESKKEFLLGDFRAFARFLDLFGGVQFSPVISPSSPPVSGSAPTIGTPNP